MNLRTPNKKFFIATILCAVVFGVFLYHKNAEAAIFGWLFGSTIVDALAATMAKIVAFLSSVIFTILGWFVTLAAKMFEYIIKPGDPTLAKFATAPIVQTGWKISRDLANMFFSLVLIIISFATILKIESYGVKNLIKNIVIAALLINFSLVIGGVIIDFSQVLTKYFFDRIGGGSGVTVTIMKSINAYKLLKPPEIKKAGDADTSLVTADLPEKEKGPINTFLITTVNMLFGSIVLILVAFVLFAGAILLIIRVIVLWFLLILAPLAWLAYLLPATSSHFHTWWSKFFKQVFFAPAYAFFLYLALSILAAGPIKDSNASTAFSAGFVINYIIIIGLLFGALIAAQQMGAAGASAAIGMAKSAKGKAQAWTTRQAMRPVKAGADRAGGIKDKVATRMNLGLSKLTHKLGMEKTEARFKLRAEKDQRQLSERPYMKKQKEILAHASDDYLAKKAKQGDLSASYVAYQKGLHRKYKLDPNGNMTDQPLMDTETVRKMNKLFTDMNDRETSGKLVEARIDALSAEKIESAVANAAQTGNLNLISAMALQNNKVVDALCKYAEPKDIENLRNRSPQHATALKTGLATARAESAAKLAAGEITDAEDNKVQFAYASHTGDISQLNLAQAQEWAKKVGPDGLKRLTITFDPTNLKHQAIADNIPASKLTNVIQNMLDGALAKQIIGYIKTTPGADGHTIANNDRYLSNL